MIMKFSGRYVFRHVAGLWAACLLGGMAAAIIATPTASAAPDCSPGGLANTVGSATGSARQYLDNHPGANDVVTAAETQPRPEAAANVRAYFTAHPQEYYELRGILQPIGDAQRQCNAAVLPSDLASAYDQFMAG
jgi:heme-binding protein